MTAYKITTDGKVTFHGSEHEAREHFKAAIQAGLTAGATAPPSFTFADCAQIVIIDPGKQGTIDALNRYAGTPKP